MTSLAAGLDAEVLLWGADGTDRRLPAARVRHRQHDQRPAPGRGAAVGRRSRPTRWPAGRRTARSPCRRIGRSGVVLIGRRRAGGGVRADDHGRDGPAGAAALRRPPRPPACGADVEAVDAWFTRRARRGRLAARGQRRCSGWRSSEELA